MKHPPCSGEFNVAEQTGRQTLMGKCVDCGRYDDQEGFWSGCDRIPVASKDEKKWEQQSKLKVNTNANSGQD